MAIEKQRDRRVISCTECAAIGDVTRSKSKRLGIAEAFHTIVA
jgi:hypothetical protein